jgi:hypothetical protein
MTDSPTGRHGPIITLSSLEWKLALTAILSAIYAVSFVAVARPTTPAPTASVSAQASPDTVAVNVQPTRVVPSTVAPPTAARAPVSRAVQPRIRTRSS